MKLSKSLTLTIVLIVLATVLLCYELIGEVSWVTVVLGGPTQYLTFRGIDNSSRRRYEQPLPPPMPGPAASGGGLEPLDPLD